MMRIGRALEQKEAGRSAEGRSAPLSLPASAVSGQDWLRGVFVAAQKFVSLDFRHDARSAFSSFSSSLR